jgi:hypothetical protein
MLRMFCSGCSSFDLVGRDSICPVSWALVERPRQPYHLDRSVRQVDKLGQHLTVLTCGIELGGVPEGEDSANQLGEALGPRAVGIRAAI